MPAVSETERGMLAVLLFQEQLDSDVIRADGSRDGSQAAESASCHLLLLVLFPRHPHLPSIHPATAAADGWLATAETQRFFLQFRHDIQAKTG